MSKVWMPLYIGDYTRDTMHLSCEEHGAYLQLMMHYWETGPLPDNDARLARIVKISAHKWKKISPTVREFFTSKDGFLHHKRIDQEKAKAAENSAKKARAAQARWEAEAEQPHMHVHKQMQCPSPSPSQVLPTEEQIPAKKKPRRKPKKHLPDGFPDEQALQWAIAAEGATRAEAEAEAEGFRNYWISEGEPKADWMATWRNRIQNAKRNGRIGNERPGNGSGNRKRSGASSHIAALGEWAGEEDSGRGETPEAPRLERGNRDPGGTTGFSQGAGGTVLDGDFQVLSTGDTKASGGGFG